MKITKFEHSCLLAETPDRVALIDPGVFSWNGGSFKLDQINRVDRILITHAHPDHCHPEFVSAVVKKFPDAVIVANEEVQNVLKEAGITSDMKLSTGCSCSFEANHESTQPIGPPPANNGFHFKDKLTHPGDCNSFNESKEILAMPFVAPWGTPLKGLDKVLELKPKYVIPIHDWFFKKEAQDWLDGILNLKLEPAGIKLVRLQPGESVDIP